MLAHAPKHNAPALKSSTHIAAPKEVTPAAGPNALVENAAPAATGHDFSRISVHPPITIQRKLAVNSPGDSYEQEADQLAEQVMRMPEPQSSCTSESSECHLQQINREPERLQTQPAGLSNSAQTEAPPIVHEVLASPGQPLDAPTRAFMEPRFGRDFSQVRVHTDARANESAWEVNARAYTAGHNIVFADGQFATQTHEGRRLLSHELAHVIQQRQEDRVIQRQPSTSSNLLTPAAATAAAAEVTRNYDEDSIRTLEFLTQRTRDGLFDSDDAEALAKVQQVFHLPPTGKPNEPLLDFLLTIVGPTLAPRSAFIHLVIQHAKLDVSGALAVVYEPGMQVASDIDQFPGGVSIIQIGNAGFASYRTIVGEIRKQLAVRPAASPVTTTAPPAILTDLRSQAAAAVLNQNMLKDPRSIKLLQGALGSKVTGKWDLDLVRHLAAKQQALGLVPLGILFDSSLVAIATEMIANGGENAVLQLIVDYYNLDRSHTFDILFDPIPPPPPHDMAKAQTTSVGGDGTPGVVRVYAEGFKQPFTSLVHTVAHELGHVDQVMKGITSLNVREFLSEGIEIESKNLPAEPLESEADLDLIRQGISPLRPGFLAPVSAMLRRWGSMTPDERRANHPRFRELRSIIFSRITKEGTAGQKAKLAQLVITLSDADIGVP